MTPEQMIGAHRNYEKLKQHFRCIIASEIHSWLKPPPDSADDGSDFGQGAVSERTRILSHLSELKTGLDPLCEEDF